MTETHMAFKAPPGMEEGSHVSSPVASAARIIVCERERYEESSASRKTARARAREGVDFCQQIYRNYIHKSCFRNIARSFGSY